MSWKTELINCCFDFLWLVCITITLYTVLPLVQGCTIASASAWGCGGAAAWEGHLRHGPPQRQLPCGGVHALRGGVCLHLALHEVWV